MNSFNSDSAGDLDVSKLTPEKLIKRLRAALQRDGDFPASAKIVAELRRLTSDPRTTANQITEVILKEPSLGTRVLHLVNSSFYQRAKPIMTVSQAVIQIGMKPLAELCSGLVLLQKFVPAARRGGSFASCLQKTICTSLLAGSLGSATTRGKSSSADEMGYLAGSFAELGTLLLAFYFPQVYDTAVKRAKAKNRDISQCIQEITGVTPLLLSREVLDALKLPEFYKEVLATADLAASNMTAQKDDDNSTTLTARSLLAAEQISDAIVFKKGKQELDQTLNKIKKNISIDAHVLDSVIGELPQRFRDHCTTIEINLGALPEFVSSYSGQDPSKETGDTKDDGGLESNFESFIEEIRQAIENREPTSSIITSVMETLAWGLKFDRVLLLLLQQNKRGLTGRMILGTSDIDPKSISRPLAPDAKSDAPDAAAFGKAKPVFFGSPIFEDGKPMVAIPVGQGVQAVGVIYADRQSTENKTASALSELEQSLISTLTELLDRSISMST